MQQSDQLLITSIRDFLSLPESIQTLSDIKADEMFAICLTFLSTISVPIDDIKAIEKQKFRSTTKLNQKLHKELEIELQLNDLLNPTVSFVRKTLLVLLSKLGSNDHLEKGANLAEEDFEKRKKKKILSAWIDDEWIHPKLVTQNRPTYQAYLFPLSINRKSIKTNLLPQLLSPSNKFNILPILTSSINHNLMKQKQTEQNTGITKKRPQQNAVIETNKLISFNFEDWNMAEQKLNKIKRKLDKDKENVEAAKKAEEEEKVKIMIFQKNDQPVVVQSVFQAQVVEKIEEKQKQKQTKPEIQLSQTTASVASQHFEISDNPFQKLQREAELKKTQYEKIIHNLISELNEKKQQSYELSTTKVKLETQIQRDEEKLIQMKNQTDELKKQVQKKQLVLTAVESPKQIEEQVKQFQEDITQMEEQLKEQVQNTTQAIETMKTQSDKKIQALQQLKMKLHRIENQYKEVCEQIEEKAQRKTKIKINKSGVSRNYYSKKISEIDKRWRETQKQVHKIKRDLEIAKQKTQSISNVTDTMQKDILALISAERNPKTQIETKALKEIFQKCQSCYKTTLDTLNKINQVKEETREYEIKVHALNSQNYRQGIEKVNTALAELKKEIFEMSKKQGR